jgi:tetratricopeptide (TPR) repeat protein
MIVSDALGQNILPFIHEAPQLDAIYVFREDSSYNEQWTKQWWKVKNTFTQISCIWDSLQQATRQCDRNMVPMSFVSVNELSNSNLDQLDPSFMYTQLLKETLLEMHKYSSKSIKEFADYCSVQYVGNPLQLKKIENFEREYKPEESILWYTSEYFIYSMLNRSLRTLEVDLILKMSFFMHDLHQQIEQLHSERSNHHQIQTSIVYRGQGLSKADFEKLRQTNGGLMSFNNFLSTSTDREVSLAFAESNGSNGSNGSNPDMIGILFEIAIDQTIPSTPFAFIGNGSKFSSEEEVLFSMHSVFRIDDIKQMCDTNEQLWQVQLTLTNDKDEDLSSLTERLREELSRSTKGWFRLGSLLMKLGQFDKAEQLYELLVAQELEDNDKIDYYNQLANISYAKCAFQKAVSLKLQAAKILQEKLLKTIEKQPFETVQKVSHPPMTRFLKDIGVALSEMSDSSNIRAKIEKSGFTVGFQYFETGDYPKAISYYKKELEKRQSTLPRNHPDLAGPYSAIGTAYLLMNDYSQALLNYKKALEIRKKSLPPFHSDLASSYNNIGMVYFERGDYSEALSYCEKALETWQNSFSPDHLDLALSYNNIGVVYENMGDFSKSSLFYEKAVEIRQKSLPPDHPDLASSCSSIGMRMKLDFC